MPYKSKEKQREASRESMRRKRMLTPAAEGLTQKPAENVNPSVNPAITIQEKLKLIKELVAPIEQAPVKKPVMTNKPPLYISGRYYPPGTELRLPDGQTIKAPALDSEGNVIPDYEPAHIYAIPIATFKPSFHPAPKPVRRK